MSGRAGVGALLVVLLGLLGGCEMAGRVAMNGANALATFGRYDRAADLPYGPHPRHRLDVYSPHGSDAAPRPVVVFFHGGDWSQGYPGKSAHRFVADALTSRGFVAVVANYRRYPEVKFPAFVEDGAAALTWTHTHIAEHGGDPGRIFIMGHSAGGHIAAMLTLDERYLLAAGGEPAWIRGFIGMAGPYSFLPLPEDPPMLKDLFGPPPRYPLSQPINYVDADEPPMLLLSGARDERVPLECMNRLADRVAQAGGQVQTITYGDLDHILLVGSLATPLRWGEPVLDDVAAFIHEVDTRLARQEREADQTKLARSDEHE